MEKLQLDNFNSIKDKTVFCYKKNGPTENGDVYIDTGIFALFKRLLARLGLGYKEYSKPVYMVSLLEKVNKLYALKPELKLSDSSMILSKQFANHAFDGVRVSSQAIKVEDLIKKNFSLQVDKRRQFNALRKLNAHELYLLLVADKLTDREFLNYTQLFDEGLIETNESFDKSNHSIARLAIEAFLRPQNERNRAMYGYVLQHTSMKDLQDCREYTDLLEKAIRNLPIDLLKIMCQGIVYSDIEKALIINNMFGIQKHPHWNNILFAAAISKDWGVVEKLIRLGENPNRQHDYTTVLQYAARDLNVEAVRMLIANGADVNARNKKGLTPLHVAVMKGALDVVVELLQNGANVDAQDSDGYTPLHYAVIAKSIKTVQVLLKHKANADLSNSTGRTPLYMAEVFGNTEILECFKGHVADITIGARSL